MKTDNVTVIVTGGCGHIGSYVIEHLCKTLTNSTIVCVDNLYNGKLSNLDVANELAEKDNNKIIINGECIEHSYNMRETFKHFKPDYVFHQASMLTLDSKMDRHQAVKVNIAGMSNVLDNCVRYHVKKLVYASSASVYGTPRLFPTKETHDFDNCKLLYGATKIACEALARSYADEEGLKIVGLRYFNVYGERQSTNNLYTQIVPKWIKAIVAGEPITIYGDGSQTMDMISGNDVGRFNVLAMFKEDLYRNDSFDGFMNICTNHETSVIGLYGLIEKELEVLGFKNTSEIIYEDHDPNLVSRRRGDNTLMLKHLGNYKISVPEGIRETVRALVKNMK
jgi:UDP-glucose 4-epimerase